MTWIVNRCPFFDTQTIVRCADRDVVVRPYQIVVWVSLSADGIESNPFPAILDTGHSHNFSLRTEHVAEWTTINPQNLQPIGIAKVNGRRVILVRSNIRLHRNARGTRDQLRGQPMLLELTQGLALHEARDPFAPRLPILGLRAITSAGLRVVIDGRKRELSIGY
jgi:hypothetical protein